MRKILTFFTVLAVAFVFAFSSSASPPTFAAEQPEVKQTVKVLIVGEPSAEFVAETITRLGAANISVVIGSQAEEPALELPDGLPNLNKTIFETARFAGPERVPIDYQLKRQTHRIANYQSPTTEYFTGFDKPARAKI